jgi:hypothetical protein
MNIVLYVYCNNVISSSWNFMITYVGLVANFVDQAVLYDYFC